jgi:hypothetical protein
VIREAEKKSTRARNLNAKARSDSSSLMVSWARRPLGTWTPSLNGNAAKSRQERQERQEKILLVRSPVADLLRFLPFLPFLPAFRNLTAKNDVPNRSRL